jgi:hypothetical protein
MYINGKMRPIELFQELGWGWVKENGGGGEFKYDIFDILKENLSDIFKIL